MPQCGRALPFDAMRERPQAGHIRAGHADAGQSAEAERREQTVAHRHAEVGQRAKGARGEINLSSGAAIGQGDQRNDGKHVAGRDNSGEPASLRVGQDQAPMNCGSSAGIIEKPARPRISATQMAATTGVEGAAVAGRARVTVPNGRKPRLGEPGFWGSTIEQGGIAIDRLVPSKHRWGQGVHTRCASSFFTRQRLKNCATASALGPARRNLQ